MKTPRKTAVLKAYAREWGVWKEVELSDHLRQEHPHLMHCKHIWANQRFEAQGFQIDSSIGGIWQLTTVRHGNLEPVTYDENQRIVHDLFGPEVYAVEIYPPIEHEWRTNLKISVLWVLPSTWALPFGLEKPSAWGKPNGN
jgi:hypothetical protein